MDKEYFDKNKEFEEDISFGKRLKELMKQNNGSDKPMSQVELQNELFKKNGNKDLVTTATISNWICGKAGLRKNKEDILRFLSEIFNVDIDYLACTQLMPKQSSLPIEPYSWKVEDRIGNFPEKDKKFRDYLLELGIKSQYLSIEGKPTQYIKILENSKIYKIRSTSNDKISYKFFYEGKTIEKTEEEYKQFLKNISNFILFSLEKE